MPVTSEAKNTSSKLARMPSNAYVLPLNTGISIDKTCTPSTISSAQTASLPTVLVWYRSTPFKREAFSHSAIALHLLFLG